MNIDIDTFLEFYQNVSQKQFNPNQYDAIQYGEGPLWIVAGPGSGKTEVLVARVLKLIICDHIVPESIMITTFTEKAAKNIQDRMLDRFEGVRVVLEKQGYNLDYINIHDVRAGTLHSICDKVMSEYGYSGYRHKTIIDDLTSEMLIYKEILYDIYKNDSRSSKAHLTPLKNTKGQMSPNWAWTKVLKDLFSQLIEKTVPIDSLVDDWFIEFKVIFEHYLSIMNHNNFVDYSMLLQLFLKFLNSPESDVFLHGDAEHQPIRYILVDEYQDTNAIQEKIYFKLSGITHSLTVVGDDDQSLYRFRGATVEQMVEFDKKCTSIFGTPAKPIHLDVNYRSNKRIVEFCNNYISGFDFMQSFRIPGKNLCAYSDAKMPYEEILLIADDGTDNCYITFANVVQYLLEQGVIEDYSQCALLLNSAKDTNGCAGKYIQALANNNIPVYNPRSKGFHFYVEIRAILGFLSIIIDPEGEIVASLNPNFNADLQGHINDIRQEAAATLADYNLLSDFITKSHAKIIAARPSEKLSDSVMTIIYKIFALQPFDGYLRDAVASSHLGQFTNLLNSFCLVNYYALIKDNDISAVKKTWVTNLYVHLYSYIFSGIDESENQEIICPQGFFPIMTYHQAKGLQFDVVFTGKCYERPFSVTTEQIIDQLLVNNGLLESREADYYQCLHRQNKIRNYYVGFSRAKHILFIVAPGSYFRNRSQPVLFGAQGGQELLRTYHSM